MKMRSWKYAVLPVIMANRILKKGDTIAMGTPIFTPYIEIAHLEDYAFEAVHVKADQEHRFQYPDEELKKLEVQFKRLRKRAENDGSPSRHTEPSELL